MILWTHIRTEEEVSGCVSFALKEKYTIYGSWDCLDWTAYSLFFILLLLLEHGICFILLNNPSLLSFFVSVSFSVSRHLWFRVTTRGPPCWGRAWSWKRWPFRACQSWSEPGYRKWPFITWRRESWTSRSAFPKVRTHQSPLILCTLQTLIVTQPIL